MANRIKIRHGSSAPTTNDLLSYELGWDGSNLALYINNNGTIELTSDGLLKFRGKALASGDNIDTIGYGSFYSEDSTRSASLTGTPPLTTAGFRLFSFAAYHSSYPFQLAVTFDDKMYIRTASNGTSNWRPWKTLLHTGNYDDYALPLTGGTISGNLTVSGSMTASSGITAGNIAVGVGSTSTLKSTISCSSALFLESASSTSIVFGQGGTDKFRLDTSNCLRPETANGISLGSSTKPWGDIYSCNIFVSRAGDTYVKCNNTNKGTAVYLDCDNDRHGIYSSGYNNGTSFVSSAAWLIARDNTGSVYLPAALLLSGAGVYYEGSPLFYWLTGSTSGYQKMGGIFVDAKTVNSKKVCNRFYFREYSYNSSTGASVENWHQYYLPAVPAGLSTSTSYGIVTTTDYARRIYVTTSASVPSGAVTGDIVLVKV